MSGGFWQEFAAYLRGGGPLMLPLAALAVYIYYSGFCILFRLAALRRDCRSGARLRENLGRYFAENLSGSLSDRASLKANFDYLRKSVMPPVSRGIETLGILAAAAPLLGLLGTVSGMTLAMGTVGGASDGVAEGVSRALITTQCGLTIAIPAMVLRMLASRMRQKILISISRCESRLILEGAPE